MSGDKLILGIPSKGRLMEQTVDYFAGLDLRFLKNGHERGYRGEIAGLPMWRRISLGFGNREAFAARPHPLGVTGEDLVREHIPDADGRCEFIARLGFGRAERDRCGAGVLDRCGNGGRSRRTPLHSSAASTGGICAARPIYESGAALFCRKRPVEISAGGKSRGGPKARPPRKRPNSSSTSRPPARRCRPTT